MSTELNNPSSTTNLSVPPQPGSPDRISRPEIDSPVPSPAARLVILVYPVDGPDEVHRLGKLARAARRLARWAHRLRGRAVP